VGEKGLQIATIGEGTRPAAISGVRFAR